MKFFQQLFQKKKGKESSASKTPQPVVCKMSQLVDILYTQDAENVLLDMIIFEKDGIRHREGASLYLHPDTKAPSYVFDRNIYPTLSDMISDTCLSELEAEIMILGFGEDTKCPTEDKEDCYPVVYDLRMSEDYRALYEEVGVFQCTVSLC